MPVFSLRPLLQKAIHCVGVDIFKPMPHGRIAPLYQSFIAIAHISPPGRLNYETAPIRAATSPPRGRGGMRQTAILTDDIVPRLEPVGIQRGDIEHYLQRQGRSVAVPAVTESLEVGTINHIAVKSEVFHCICHHIVDLVQILVRAFE